MPAPLLVLSQLHLELHPPLRDHLLIQGPLDLLPLLLDLDLLLALELLLVVLDQLDQMPLPMMPLLSLVTLVMLLPMLPMPMLMWILQHEGISGDLIYTDAASCTLGS